MQVLLWLQLSSYCAAEPHYYFGRIKFIHILSEIQLLSYVLTQSSMHVHTNKAAFYRHNKNWVMKKAATRFM